MGAPALPFQVPADRLKAVTMRSLQPPDHAEAETFAFLSDSKEYLVDDPADQAVIRELDPAARFYQPA